LTTPLNIPRESSDNYFNLHNNDNIVISVKDNGYRYRQKRHRTTCFEKYYRVSTGDVHNIKGFGLGLTYFKKLVE
jgi:signal transduction histidine kinase